MKWAWRGVVFGALRCLPGRWRWLREAQRGAEVDWLLADLDRRLKNRQRLAAGKKRGV